MMSVSRFRDILHRDIGIDAVLVKQIDVVGLEPPTIIISYSTNRDNSRFPKSTKRDCLSRASSGLYP
jgi:hypothetical protein